MAASSEALLKVPAPWQCKAQVYSMFFQSKPGKSSTGDIAAMLYSPLEAESEFAAVKSGSLQKGLAGLMVIRYSDTPVGPYDELLVIPGPFSYSVMENGVAREKKNSRISRIYVSQKHTTYNGRYSKSQCKFLGCVFKADILPICKTGTSPSISLVSTGKTSQMVVVQSRFSLTTRRETRPRLLRARCPSSRLHSRQSLSLQRFLSRRLGQSTWAWISHSCSRHSRKAPPVSWLEQTAGASV